MVAEQARLFSAMGYVVAVPDLYGTGDSEGDFGDASWDAWREDIDHLVSLLLHRGVTSLCFWGLRLGALLALDCAGKYRDILNTLLFWQPVVNGKTFLTQFLRLKVAADMLEANRKTTTRELREQLEAGGSVEVAGYQLASGLALPIDRLCLTDIPLRELPGITWLELLPGEGRPVPAMTENAVTDMRAAGVDVDFHSLVGEPFWSLQELAVVPGLIETTCHCCPAAN